VDRLIRLAIVMLGVAAMGNPVLLVAQGRGVPGDIVFNSARDGNNEIYRMTWDGHAPLRLTNDPASDVEPAMSPNGRDVIFASNRTGNNDIFVVGSAGGTAINLTNNPANDGWARWSPNGRQIVFHSNRDGNFEIYVMNADGTRPTRVTDSLAVDQYPDWSHNGREIVFRHDTDIYTLDLARGETTRLTTIGPLNQMATWSPNGRQLVFMSTRDGYPSVFLMNADGTGQTSLTPKAPGDDAVDWVSRAPSWSRNGQLIFFMSSRPSTGLDTEIFAMLPNGTGVRRLTHSVGVDGSPRGR
jgi:Tol biopolymer transport system component